MNYEQELQNLKNAQKNAAVSDLQATRDTSLSNLQAEEAKIKPTYAAQRSTANANNRVAARNFQEYLANTGRANSGIGAQYEMSRQNTLQNGLNAINSQEAADIADIARRRSDIQNAYNTNLASANAQVEANYIQNLLDQRQKQWEREFQQKQFDESVRQYNQNRQDALNRAFSSGGGSSSGSYRTSTSSGNKSSESMPGGLTSAVSRVLDNVVNKDYNVSAVTSPGSFSTKGAANYYTSNVKGVKTKSQLDSAIATGLKKGLITQADANKIYKAYGIK